MGTCSEERSCQVMFPTSVSASHHQNEKLSLEFCCKFCCNLWVTLSLTVYRFNYLCGRDIEYSVVVYTCGAAIICVLQWLMDLR